MMIPSHDNHYDSVYDDDNDDNDDEEEDDTLSDNIDPLGNNLLMHRVHKFSHLYTDIGQLLQNIIISTKNNIIHDNHTHNHHTNYLPKLH